MQRDHQLAALRRRDDPFDFVIVGGGATGLGAAVDAASRGHSVALVEQADFAKATSSRSTKLVHGGVRYLQQGNVSLVLEALRERGRLTRNAPHLVHDLAFVIPNYHWWEGPFYGIGMKVYDQLAGKLGLGPSQWLSREETIQRLPNVETEDLRGGVIYHDGQFDDSRLAVALARTAAHHGAHLANYLRCEGLDKEDGLVRGARVRDLEGGDEFTLPARCVINATGIFADELRQRDAPEAPSVITSSQGIHLVLPREFLAGDAAIMIPRTSDGRVLFAVPWHGRVVLGTTDTPVPEPSLEPRALPEEIDFVLENAARYLDRDPSHADVCSVFAGLRPLVGSEGADTAEISRDHSILVSASGLVTIAGGKWTTYRQMAEDVINQASGVAGLELRPCETVDLRLQGWTRQPIEPARLRPYGADAALITELGEIEAIHPDLHLSAAEVRWFARSEMARTVEDVLARRHRALLLDARASIEAAPTVAALLEEELAAEPGWPGPRLDEYRELAAGYLP